VIKLLLKRGNTTVSPAALDKSESTTFDNFRTNAPVGRSSTRHRRRGVGTPFPASTTAAGDVTNLTWPDGF
jgi:hypothetical protein